MHAVIGEIEYLFSGDDRDTKATYDRVADHYERFREVWLTLAGVSVERAMLDDLATILQPARQVLDAGCGTGALSQRIRQMEPRVALTLLDLSPAMLAHAEDVPGRHLVGSVLDFPFDDGTFDVVVSGWVIETVPDPLTAVTEYLRVINDDGYVLYTFCSLPNGWLSRAGTALLRGIIEHRFAGHFLRTEETPWHDCERSRRVRSRPELTTYVLLRKCCHVEPEILPSHEERLPVPSAY